MKNIVIEFKFRKLDRPMLDQIVGTAFRNNLTPPSDIVIKCRTATATAYRAAEDYKKNRKVNIHIDPCLSAYEEI